MNNDEPDTFTLGLVQMRCEADPATNLAKAWTALHDAFSAIATSAQAAAQEDAKAKAQSQVEPPAEPETGTD